MEGLLCQTKLEYNQSTFEEMVKWDNFTVRKGKMGQFYKFSVARKPYICFYIVDMNWS